MTEDELLEAMESYQGFCTHCKELTRGETEPDAENYECPKCGTRKVIGVELALLQGLITID